MTMDARASTDPAIARLLPAYGALRTREDLGGYKFPSTADTMVLSHALTAVGASPDDVAVAAQQDWFGRGQTGCVFARIAALKYDDGAWPYAVVHADDDFAQVDALVGEHCVNPNTQVLSLLFVDCATLGEFRASLERLVDVTSFYYKDRIVTEESVSYQVRREVFPGVEAWIMAFGPDSYLPSTRRAPFYELAVRVKPKNGTEYRRLNQDPGAAHLADFPLQMPPAHWDDRWDSTTQRTRRILGHEPDEVSAARSTLTVPRELVDSAEGFAHSDAHT